MKSRNKRIISLIILMLMLSSCGAKPRSEAVIPSVPAVVENEQPSVIQSEVPALKEAEIDPPSTTPSLASEDKTTEDAQQAQAESDHKTESDTKERLVFYITTDNVNLRETPNTESARITTVARGKTVRIIDFNDYDWFLVDYEGQTGYMKAEFLTAGVYQVVIPIKYVEVGDYSEGSANFRLVTPIRSDSKEGDLVSYQYGFIDKKGNDVTPREYTAAGSFSEGLAWVRRGDVYYLERDDDVLFHRSPYQDGKSGFIDTTGNEVIPLIYDSVSDFSYGVSVVRINKQWGLIDKNGNEIAKLDYHDVDDYSEGMSKVRVDNSRWSASRWSQYGFIDATGKEIIPCKYSHAGDFSEGMATVMIGDWATRSVGFIDKQGNEMIITKYGSVSSFSDGMALVWIGDWIDGESGYIDKSGKEVVPIGKYNMWSQSNIDFDFSDGLAIVSDGEYEKGKLGFIDKTGELVIQYKYDWADRFSEGLSAVNIGAEGFYGGGADIPFGGKWGFINKAGHEVISLKYDHVRAFAEGFAAVNMGIDLIFEHNAYLAGGKWGFIDKTGKEVVPLIFDSVRDFSNGMAAVCLDGKWGFISVTPDGTLYSPSATAVANSQSQIPFLGFEEIEPFFKGRNTVSDWIKDIKVYDADYKIYVSQATADAMLEISVDGRIIAEFAFEMDDREAQSMLDNYTILSLKNLDKRYLSRKVIRVFFIDFTDMGIPYNIRGISNGSSVSDVKKVFLDTKENKDVMYNWMDVVSDAIIDDFTLPAISGIDNNEAYPQFNHNSSRSIEYYHMSTYDFDGNGSAVYSIYNEYTLISFAIDEKESVISLIYRDISHRN